MLLRLCIQHFPLSPHLPPLAPHSPALSPCPSTAVTFWSPRGCDGPCWLCPSAAAVRSPSPSSLPAPSCPSSWASSLQLHSGSPWCHPRGSQQECSQTGHRHYLQETGQTRKASSSVRRCLTCSSCPGSFSDVAGYQAIKSLHAKILNCISPFIWKVRIDPFILELLPL